MFALKVQQGKETKKFLASDNVSVAEPRTAKATCSLPLNQPHWQSFQFLNAYSLGFSLFLQSSLVSSPLRFIHSLLPPLHSLESLSHAGRGFYLFLPHKIISQYSVEPALDISLEQSYCNFRKGRRVYIAFMQLGDRSKASASDSMAAFSGSEARICRVKPALEPLITHIQRPLAPLHPVPFGPPHPAFPKAILNYHLLTEAQLDSIARYYHQDPTSPTLLTHCYPACMNWDRDFLEHLGATQGVKVRINAKRRKFGKFIGLRGCETPIEEVEEKERWIEWKYRMALKAGGMSFFGRTGFGEW